MLNAAAETWTPDTNAAALPRADRHELRGSSRVYFFDLDTRAEITEHPLSGLVWCSSGAMVTHKGRYVDNTMCSVGGAAYIDGVARRVRVTADSFPGRRVVAKVWRPGEVGDTEWRVLAKGDDSEVKGKQPRVGREWIEMFKRGEVA